MEKSKHIFIFGFLCFINSAFSQSVESDTSKSVINLNEVIISVNKNEETRRTVAQQVQVIKAGDIANLQAQSTADLIANSGNVFLQKSQQGGGSPVLRGFEANRVLLVIDGVRMNNLIYRAGHLQNIVTLDNSILDRVEILFGPTSNVYGSDALGGVIHMYTKKPVFSTDESKNFKANAFIRYGTVNNEFAKHIDFNVGGKKLASLTSFTHSDFDDLKGGENQNPFYTSSYGERHFYVQRINNRDSLIKNNDRYLQVQSGFKQYDILQKFAYKANDKIIHGLNFQFSNSGDVPRYDRLTDPQGTGLRFAEWYYGPQKRLMAAYDMNIQNNSAKFQKIHAGINYQDIEESRHTRRFGNDNLEHRIENVGVMGANLDIQRNATYHILNFGADAQFNSLESTANVENVETGVSSPLDTRYPDGDNSMTNAAVYLSHKWSINQEVTLVDGFRLGMSSLSSTFNDTSFFNFPYNKAEQSNFVYSGSIGLIHTPTEDLKLSMLIATGFRVPNVDDLSKVFESAPGRIVVPNPDLKPEKSVTAEAGVTRIYNSRTSWENTFYFTTLTDAIVSDVFTLNGEDSILYNGTMSQVVASQNKQRAYVWGLSSNIRTQWTENLALSWAMNYTYGRIKTDSMDYPLDHIPPFMMRLQLNYLFKNFSTDFFINYNGWKRIENYNLGGEDNQQYATPAGMPAWLTANVHFSYKVHSMITLQTGMDNILDTQYRAFASGINAPGRNIFACVRFSY
jgi:hemoglobin/transferrin/lactoferrin receptor protein